MYLLKKDFGFTNNLDFLSALLTLSERVGRTSLSEYVKIQHGLKAPVPYNATFLRGSTKKNQTLIGIYWIRFFSIWKLPFLLLWNFTSGYNVKKWKGLSTTIQDGYLMENLLIYI